MNRKGQVLISFVLLLPLFVLLLAYVLDNGLLLAEKTSLDQINKEAISYALGDRSRTEEDVLSYFSHNGSSWGEITVYLDEVVQIRVEKEVPRLFHFILGESSTIVSSYYEGEMVDGEVVYRKLEN